MTVERIVVSGILAFVATILIGFSTAKVESKEKNKVKSLSDYLENQESDNNGTDKIDAISFGKEEIYTALGFPEVSDLFKKVNTITIEKGNGEFAIEPKNKLHYKVTVSDGVAIITKLDGIDMPVRTIIVSISDLNEVVQGYKDGSQTCTDINI